MGNTWSSIVPLLSTLIAVVLILVLSFYVSKKIAQGATRLNRSRYIDVIDRVVIGQESSITIIKVNQRYFMVAISASAITLLSELNGEDILPVDKKDADLPALQLRFKEMLLDKMPNKNKNK